MIEHRYTNKDKFQDRIKLRASGINGNSRLADVGNRSFSPIGRGETGDGCIGGGRLEKQIRGRRWWFKVKEKFVAKDADRIARAILRSAPGFHQVRQVWAGSPPLSASLLPQEFSLSLSISAAHKSCRVSPNEIYGQFLNFDPCNVADILIFSFVRSLQ